MDTIDFIRDRVKNLEEDNLILRELLWRCHGHPSEALYGDDGEMQCSQCLKEYGFFDWKRTPVKEIQERIYKGNMKKVMDLLKKTEE